MTAGRSFRGGVATALAALALGASATEPAALAGAVVRAGSTSPAVSHDGVVEAVRQTVLAAQVPGAVVALTVKAGDTVKAGQVLVRLDARAAEQNAAAAAAQVLAARAAQDAAAREFDRQKQLFEKSFISKAALDRAEEQYRATQAQAAAQLATAGAARTQSSFSVVTAPYAGVVAEVPVVLGDMAMPGRPLVTLYDPAALRVTARVPQTLAARVAPGAGLQVELPGVPGGRIAPVRWQVLPTIDPASHTLELRLDLPAGVKGATPGMFARAWLPGTADEGRLYVPRRAVVRRAELAGVYVIDGQGRALLRQVRLGRAEGDEIEVLAGLSAGERVALEPQAAARERVALRPDAADPVR